MRYYLDCEFNGYLGTLVSLALVREDGESLYVIMLDSLATPLESWVCDHVIPVLTKAPHCRFLVSGSELAEALETFLADDPHPHIVADWPDDFAYLCRSLITAPGEMVDTPGLTMEVVRVDAYPTTLPNAVQHNAWWDAMALRHYLVT